MAGVHLHWYVSQMNKRNQGIKTKEMLFLFGWLGQVASMPVTRRRSRKLQAITRQGFEKAVTTTLPYNRMFMHTT